MRALLSNSLAAVCSLVVVSFVSWADCGGDAAQKDRPRKLLKWVFADIKHPLRALEKKAEEKAITGENYKKIIDGIKTNLHANGVRVYIDPDIKDPANYSKLYRDVIAYAKEQELAIYANPFETSQLRMEKFGNDKVAFANWIVAYANHFRPEFLGPFNESGWSAGDMVEITVMVRKKLKYAPKLVGPDVIHISKSNELLGKNSKLAGVFDVISSHNAAKDEEATAQAWQALRRLAGKPTWASENPRPVSIKNAAGKEIGIRAVLESKSVEGLVIYLAYPRCVNDDGSLTEKGREIERAIAEQ